MTAMPITADDVRAVLDEPSRLTLVAQPICDLRRGGIVGYELLSRFRGGHRPDHMFAAAIAHGLGEELESLALGHALALAQTKPANTFITVNVDPLHVLSPRIQAVLDTQPNLAGLVFELTEHRPTDDVKPIRRVIDALRARGAMFALDDAGAGHSGLKQLLEYQPQFVKIDRDLVTDIHLNEAKRALVQMVGHLVARLDAWVLCEGIENEAECNALRQLGIPLGQGYFLARPAPPWSGIDPRAAAVLQDRPIEHDGVASVDAIVEPCAIIHASESWPELVKMAIRVDENRRPTAMRLSTEGGAVVRTESQLLRVRRGASLAELALRATTRTEHLRWDPLVCIDDRGLLAGVIPVQRLVTELATESLECKRAPASTLPRSRTIQPMQH